jgi:hypothetical protein
LRDVPPSPLSQSGRRDLLRHHHHLFMVKEALVWWSQTSTVSDMPTRTATSIGRTHITSIGRTHIRTHTRGPWKPLVRILEYPHRVSHLGTPLAAPLRVMAIVAVGRVQADMTSKFANVL